jgi:hypothetical protein
VGFGQHFHITVPEKLGLTFIMDLFKLHFTDLRSENNAKMSKNQPSGLGR